MTRKRRRSTIAIKYMTLTEPGYPRQKRPEAYRSGEKVELKCGVCGQILYKTTIGELLIKKTAGALSNAINQSGFYSHMQETDHAELVSNHELVIVHDHSAIIYKGTVGIKLNYP